MTRRGRLTTPTIRLALPYRPSEDLTTFIYSELEAALGEDIDIVLEVEQDRGAIEDLSPYVLILGPLAYVGKILLATAIQKSVEHGARRFAALMRRLRQGDDDRKDRDVHFGDTDRDVVFILDQHTLEDPRSVPEMARVDTSMFPPYTQLRWDEHVGCWRLPSTPVSHGELFG